MDELKSALIKKKNTASLVLNKETSEVLDVTTCHIRDEAKNANTVPLESVSQCSRAVVNAAKAANRATAASRAVSGSSRPCPASAAVAAAAAATAAAAAAASTFAATVTGTTAEEEEDEEEETLCRFAFAALGIDADQ